MNTQKQNKLWAVRPTAKDTDGSNFAWNIVSAEDALEATKLTAGFRKSGGFKPLPTYEAVPQVTGTGHVGQHRGTRGAHDRFNDNTGPETRAKNLDTLNAMFDWDKRVEVQL